MQKGYQTYFKERALYYTTYPINEQGRHAHDMYIKKKAEGHAEYRFNWDYNLRPVIVVAILNFRFAHQDDWPKDEFRSSYRLHEDTNGEVMTEALRFVFLELGRFNKYIWELETVTEKWMYLLKHMHEMVEIPQEFSDPLFTRLFLLAEIDNFTAEEKKLYHKSLENMGDYYNIINTAVEEATKRALEEGRAEGVEKGLAEGMEKGMEKERLANAIKFKELGVDVNIISQATGLSVEEILKLQA